MQWIKEIVYSHEGKDYCSASATLGSMATPKPNRTLEGQTLLRHTNEQKARWELARRAVEARLYPDGSDRVPLQQWILDALNRAADEELNRKKR